MNHCVPDFEIQNDDEEFPILVSKKPSTQTDDIMELLWQKRRDLELSQRCYLVVAPQLGNLFRHGHSVCSDVSSGEALVLRRVSNAEGEFLIRIRLWKLLLNEEEVINMPELLNSMAKALIITLSALQKGFNWVGGEIIVELGFCSQKQMSFVLDKASDCVIVVK